MSDIQRGEIWWADLPEPRRSEPGYRRPDFVIQRTPSTSAQLADAPGNVLLPGHAAGLARDSVVNVSQLLTLERSFLTELAGRLSTRLQESVNEGLRIVLQL